MVDIGGQDRVGQRSAGVAPEPWWSSQLILEACSLAVTTFIYLDPGFRLPVLMRPSHAANAIEVSEWQGWEAKVQWDAGLGSDNGASVLSY